MPRTSPRPANLDAYPYVSYKTFQSFLDFLSRQGVPSVIDRTVMPDLNGFNQGLVLTTLRFLNLIDANGNARPALKQLQKGWKSNRPRVLAAVLRPAYPDLLAARGFSVANASPAQFDARFRRAGNPDVQRKAKTFFLRAAADAGIAISPRLQPSLRGIRRRSPAPGGVDGRPATDPSAVEPPAEPVDPQTLYLRELQRLREDFPVFNDQWPTEEKLEWYKRRFELLDRIQGSIPAEPADQPPPAAPANDPRAGSD